MGLFIIFALNFCAKLIFIVDKRGNKCDLHALKFAKTAEKLLSFYCKHVLVIYICESKNLLINQV